MRDSMRKTAIGRTIGSKHSDPWQELAAAIIRQAVIDDYECRKDLRMWQRKAKRATGPQLRVCTTEIRRLEGIIKSSKAFFYSEHFQLLCNMDGPLIYKAMQENFRSGRKPLVEKRKWGKK